MSDKKLRIISFLDYSSYNNIYNEFVKYDQIELYSCFIDTLESNSTLKFDDTILDTNRINDLRIEINKPIPVIIMEAIYAKHIVILLRIVNRYSDMLGIQKCFDSVQKKTLEVLDYSYNFIISKNPNLILYNEVPHLPIEYSIYALTKEMGIENKILFSMQLNNTEDKSLLPIKVTSSIDSNPFMYLDKQDNNTNKKLTNSFNTNILLPIVNSNYLYRIYNKILLVIVKIMKSEDRSYILRTIRFSITHRIRKVVYLSINNRILTYYKRIINESGTVKFDNIKFYYFPIHSQPEASTQARTQLYEDQLYVIRLVSNALPKGTKLIIKEHPVYFMRKNYEDIRYYRNKSFYKLISSMENVILLDYSIPSKELINKSLGIISITGSVIAEAYLNNKPALVFGQTSYVHLENVTKVHSDEDISLFLETNNKVENSNKYKHEDEYNFKKLFSGFRFVKYYELNNNDKNFKTEKNKALTKLILEDMSDKFSEI